MNSIFYCSWGIRNESMIKYNLQHTKYSVEDILNYISKHPELEKFKKLVLQYCKVDRD